MSSALAPARPEPIHFGKYLLVERLGRGGMAEVWKARMVGPAGFERTMVIKRILPQFARDPDFVAMFVDEARVCARHGHPNIVQVFDAGEDEELGVFLVMELLKGEDLSALVTRKKALPPREAATIAMQAAQGLARAHAAGDETRSERSELTSAWPSPQERRPTSPARSGEYVLYRQHGPGV